jgi:hypothetical protein
VYGVSIDTEQALRDGPEKMGPPQGERESSLNLIIQPFALRSILWFASVSKGVLARKSTLPVWRGDDDGRIHVG